MTLSTLTQRNEYTGTGALATFPYTFRILADTDLLVFVAGTLKVLNTHYSVTGEGVSTGGNVVFDAAHIPAAAAEIVILRAMPQTQETDFAEGSKLPAETLEETVDRAVMLAQDLKERLDRALILAPSSLLGPLVLPTGAGKTLRWNGAGTALEAVSPDPGVGSVFTDVTVNGNILGDGDVEITGIADLITKGPWVDVRHASFAGGAVGDGIVDDTAAIQAAATAAEGKTLLFPAPSVKYKVTGTITLLSNTTIIGIGRPLIETTSKTLPIFQGGVVTNITIKGLRLKGAGSDGAAGDLGLIDINQSVTNGAANIRIFDNEVSNFRNGICVVRAENVWIERNYVHNFYRYGILASGSYNFHIDRNNVYDCDFAGADNAYGVMATGNFAGGKPTDASSISFNKIANIPAWDGIMSHDVDGLSIIGNDIRNVRMGVDLGMGLITNIIKNVRISGNYIKATLVDTWGGALANHGGILVTGWNSGNLITNVAISNNIIDGFFSVAGMTVWSGGSSNITVEYTRRATVTGNVIINAGDAAPPPDNAGIWIVGECDGIVVSGNTMQGTMVYGGVRFSGATGIVACVSGNVVRQNNTAHPGIKVASSTIETFALGDNSSNSDSGLKVVFATNTILSIGGWFNNSVAHNPASINAGAQWTAAIDCPGAALGDYAEAAFSLDHAGVTLHAYVSASAVVTVVWYNGTAGVVDLGNGTLRVRARRDPAIT